MNLRQRLGGNRPGVPAAPNPLASQRPAEVEPDPEPERPPIPAPDPRRAPVIDQA